MLVLAGLLGGGLSLGGGLGGGIGGLGNTNKGMLGGLNLAGTTQKSMVALCAVNGVFRFDDPLPILYFQRCPPPVLVVWL